MSYRQEIETRLWAGSVGPWKRRGAQGIYSAEDHLITVVNSGLGQIAMANRDFIVHANEDIHRLLGVVDWVVAKAEHLSYCNFTKTRPTAHQNCTCGLGPIKAMMLAEEDDG